MHYSNCSRLLLRVHTPTFPRTVENISVSQLPEDVRHALDMDHSDLLQRVLAVVNADSLMCKAENLGGDVCVYWVTAAPS